MIRKPAFDAAVDYARNGVGGISKLSPAHLVPLTNMLGPALPDRHVLTLLSVPRPNSGHALVFMARFYGGLAEAVLLAEFEAPISGLEKPILLLVDYVPQPGLSARRSKTPFSERLALKPLEPWSRNVG